MKKLLPVILLILFIGFITITVMSCSTTKKPMHSGKSVGMDRSRMCR